MVNHVGFLPIIMSALEKTAKFETFILQLT